MYASAYSTGYGNNTNMLVQLTGTYVVYNQHNIIMFQGNAKQDVDDSILFNSYFH